MTTAPISETTVIETITFEDAEGCTLSIIRYADNTVMLKQGSDSVYLDPVAIARVKALT